MKHNLEGQGAEGAKDQQRGRNPPENEVFGDAFRCQASSGFLTFQTQECV